MAKATLTISSKNYSSWSLRGWLLCRMAGLDFEEKVLPSSLRPLFPESRIVGEAFTVEGHDIPRVGWDEGIERMRPYLEVFERLTPDSVLVSTTPGGRAGHFGELTANAARAHGCVGTILDGNLRDIEGLRAIGFPVFYRDLSPLNGIGRWEMTHAQQPVAVGGVTVNPGDIVFAEFDGILIVPRADAVATSRSSGGTRTISPPSESCRRSAANARASTLVRMV